MRLWQVDAFTSEPFRGNPAAVCLLPETADAGWMQAVAAEMNLSETAFVWPTSEDSSFGLRWFTPVGEVPLCGHATLATAHVLWSELDHDLASPLRFQTMSGDLIARRSIGGIDLDFPIKPLPAVAVPEHLSEAIGIEVVETFADERRYLVEMADEASVRDLRADFAALGRLDRGVVVTARSDGKPYDFVSRYFAVPFGVPEDPVTGSAHCSLAPYWRERLGEDEFFAFQASPRGGALGVRIDGERVILTGQAVTVLRGELLA